MASIYDLVYDYMDTFFSEEELNNDKAKTIHNEIKKLLKNGWCSVDLYAGFNAWRTKNPTKKTIFASNLFVTRSKSNKNLLEYGKFYYHNALRKTSPPPMRFVDYDSGVITSMTEEYFLEMEASFDVEDVANYYCKQFGIKPSNLQRKRMIGTFNYLLNGHEVEEILYMIDAAANECRSEDLPPLKTPLDITDYEDKAKETRAAKRTEAVLSGGNKIVRKKRMRRSRNGD